MMMSTDKQRTQELKANSLYIYYCTETWRVLCMSVRAMERARPPVCVCVKWQKDLYPVVSSNVLTLTPRWLQIKNFYTNGKSSDNVYESKHALAPKEQQPLWIIVIISSHLSKVSTQQNLVDLHIQVISNMFTGLQSSDWLLLWYDWQTAVGCFQNDLIKGQKKECLRLFCKHVDLVLTDFCFVVYIEILSFCIWHGFRYWNLIKTLTVSDVCLTFYIHIQPCHTVCCFVYLVI